MGRGVGDFLGTVAPIAAGFMTGGAGYGLGAQIAAGAGTGALVSLAKGEDPLAGGIMGGISGVSGGDLAGGLGSFGGTTATDNAIKASMVQNPMSAALTSSGAIPGAVQGAQNAFMNPMLSAAGGRGIQTALPGATGIGGNAMTTAGGRGISQTTNLAGKIGAGGYVPPNISAGLSEAVKDPMAFFTDYGGGSALKGGLKTAATAGGPLLQGMEPSGISQGQMKADEKYDPNRRLNLSMDTGISKYMSDDYDTGLRLLAQGGPVQKYADGGLSLNLNSGETEGEETQGYKEGGGLGLRGLMSSGNTQGSMTNTSTGEVTDMSGQPMIDMLRKAGIISYEQGGYLETGGMLGDGMSDDIKATIEGDQEARLSDGEFVLPADVVSHLGNGSSDAGAKQLYAMMDRLRKDRTGTTKQGKEINPGRYMPA